MSQNKEGNSVVSLCPNVAEWPVRVTVVEAHPECGAKHKVGDIWEQAGVRKERIKGFICPTAFIALSPIIYALRYGAEFPWAQKDSYTAICPDPETPVKFKIERLRGKVWMAAEGKWVEEKVKE